MLVDENVKRCRRSSSFGKYFVVVVGRQACCFPCDERGGVLLSHLIHHGQEGVNRPTLLPVFSDDRPSRISLFDRTNTVPSRRPPTNSIYTYRSSSVDVGHVEMCLGSGREAKGESFPSECRQDCVVFKIVSTLENRKQRKSCLVAGGCCCVAAWISLSKCRAFSHRPANQSVLGVRSGIRRFPTTIFNQVVTAAVEQLPLTSSEAPRFQEQQN